MLAHEAVMRLKGWEQSWFAHLPNITWMAAERIVQADPDARADCDHSPAAEDNMLPARSAA